LAKLTLLAELPEGYLLRGYGQEEDKLIKTGETVNCLPLRAIQFVGSDDFTVELDDNEITTINTKTLEHVVESSQFEDVESLKQHYTPKTSFVSKVLPKKSSKETPAKETLEEPASEKTLEETSDEADSADTSE